MRRPLLSFAIVATCVPSVVSAAPINFNNVIFSQDFSAGGAPGDYDDGTQHKFDWIGGSGSYSITGNALRYTAPDAYHYGAIARTTDFTTVPQIGRFSFDFSIANNTELPSENPDYRVGIGDNFTNNANFPNGDNTFAAFGINQTTTPGTFVVGGQNFSGTQTFRWYLNDSAAAFDYTAPDGSVHTLAAGTWDLWVGLTQVNNGSDGGDLVGLANFKFRDQASNAAATLTFDNFEFATIPEPASLALLAAGAVLVAPRRRG